MSQTKTTPYSLRKNLLVLAVTAALTTGCGSSDPTTPTVVEKTAIGGVAAKGIVSKGIVTAYILNEDGSKGDIVGADETDSTGKYTLTTATSYDGVSPLLIELTAGTETEMTCDSYDGCGATKHGDPISLAGNEDFKLSSVIPGTGSDKSISASITAFTSMAANSIIKSGTVNDEDILKTTSKINQIVGVNILDTPPVNVASDALLSAASEDAQRYSVMLAALATQAFEGSTTTPVEDMLANLENYNTDFEDGNVGSAGGLSLSGLYEEVVDATNAAGNSLSNEAINNLTLLSNSVKGQLNSEGVFTPTATAVENPSEIAQAKAFIADARTLAGSIQDLESTANAFDTEASTIVDTLGPHSEAVLEVYAHALGTTINTIINAYDNEEEIPTSVNITGNSEDEVIGKVNISKVLTDSASKFVLTSSDLLGGANGSKIALNTTIDISLAIEPDTISAGDTTLSIDGSVSDDSVKVMLSNAKFTIGLAKSLDTSEDAEPTEPTFTKQSLSGELSIEMLNDGVATNSKIEADAEINYVALNSSLGGSLDNDMNLSLQKIALNNLSVANSTGSVTGLSAELVIDNAASFDALSYLNHEPVMDFYVNGLDINVDALKTAFNLKTITQYGYFPYQASASSVSSLEASTSLNDYTCAGGYDNDNKYVYQDCLYEDTINIHQQVKDLAFNHPYVDSVNVENYHWTGLDHSHGYGTIEISDMETAESFLDATLTLTGKVSLAGKSDVTLSIIGDKTGINEGKVSAAIGYDGKSLFLSSQKNEDEYLGDKLTLSNADGVTISLEEGADSTSGTVKVGDKTVGTIENDGIIRFNDGTFQSL